jgi:hypothetical protein
MAFNQRRIHNNNMISLITTALLQLLLLLTAPVADGCSCMGNPGNTASEQAKYIVEETDWIEIVAVATFVNETSYADDEMCVGLDNECKPLFEYQNTTFVVNEIVYNRGNDTLTIKNIFDVDDNGTMFYHAKTTTTCCLCGIRLKNTTIGKDYLLPLSGRGGSLTFCSDICLIEDESCNDLATALRSSSGGRLLHDLFAFVVYILSCFSFLL